MTSAEINRELDRLATAYPDAVEVRSAPHRSFEGKEIKYAVIPKGPAPDGALAVLATGGLLGNETMAPVALLEFIETYAAAINAALAAPPPRVFNPISVGGFTVSKERVANIVNNLRIYVVPLVNPDGRDYHLSVGGFLVGRKNRNPEVAAGETAATSAEARGVCINRNFDILWDYKTAFKRLPATGDYPRYMNTQGDPSGDSYRGKAALSEKETLNVAALFNQDSRITFVFDIHGQAAAGPLFNINYPWGFEENQSTDPKQCFGNPAWNGKRDGYNPNDAARTYGEYMHPDWLNGPNPVTVGRGGPLGLVDIGSRYQDAIVTAALPGSGRYSLEQGPAGPAGFCYTGSIDDYAFSLDREHMRAFTIECADLQPQGAELTRQKKETTAGLLGSIAYIADQMQLQRATSDPSRQYGRKIPSSSPCPPAALPGGGGGGGVGPPKKVQKFFKYMLLPLGFGGAGSAWATRLTPLVPLLTPGAGMPLSLPPWLAAFIFSRWSGSVTIVPPSTPAPATGPPVYSGPPVHALRLDHWTLLEFERVYGTVLDQSLNLTQLNPQGLQLWLTRILVGGVAMAAGNWRIPALRILGPQQIEFDVPAVWRGPGAYTDPTKIPAGTYTLSLRYGASWYVPGEQQVLVI